MIHTTLLLLLQAALAPLEPPKSQEAALGLKEVHLPAGLVPGFDVEWPGKTGNQTKYVLDEDGDGTPDWAGFRFIGEGRELTHVVPMGSWDSTISIGPTAIRVEFEGLTVHGGPRKAIHQGVEFAKTYQPVALVFQNWGLVADEPGAGPWVPPAGSLGNTSVWGVMTYNASIEVQDAKIDWTRGAEHAMYAHGIAEPGILWVDVEVFGSGGECLKLATRPGEVFWRPGLVNVVRCDFRNWGPQPWSWRGGGGVVIQGGGVDVLIQDSRFYGGPGNRKSRGVMIDDGGSGRFYSALDGTPGEGPANGWVILEDVLIAGDGLASWGTVCRVGTLSPGAGIEVARGFGLFRCGVYSLAGGEPVKLELAGIPSGLVVLHESNTPEIRSAADALVPVGLEGQVTSPWGIFPISKGRTP